MSGSVIARRSLLKSGLFLPAAVQTPSAFAHSAEDDIFSTKALYADVQRYAEAGNKQSGGEGDRLVASWAKARLAEAGFAVESQDYAAPYFKSEHCSLQLGERDIPLIAQPLVVQTPRGGIQAPLRLADVAENLSGAIAVVRLPHRRWSSLLDPTAKRALQDAINRGALAILLVTYGPSGEALLMNVPANGPLSPVPTALLAPKNAEEVIEAARHGEVARITLLGEGGNRNAQNIIGKIIRKDAPWIVISTPRSGWTDCVGERGPGFAIWLALARWMPSAFPHHGLMFLSNSGHEYENLGAQHGLGHVGPPPDQCDFWFHLGANVATRDYQELPSRLLPLPSADPFRILMTSPDVVAAARKAFAGQAGLEMAYPSTEGASGELSEIVKAGYPRHAGIFGSHRFHHAPSDNLLVIEAALVSSTAAAVQRFLAAVIPQRP